jgi:hypothetical protein
VVFEDSELRAIEASWKSDEAMARIETNWKTFEKWCEQLGDRTAPVREMLNHYEERACLAPASSRVEFHNAFPGGFIDHSLRVLRTTIDLAAALKVKVPKEALIISTLFHDWGKLGTLEDEYYLPNDSEWHRKRGQMYVKNPKMVLSNAQLSLFTLSHFNVKLSTDEYTAILLNDGPNADANREYAMREPKLALLVHMADRWATQCEKNRKSILDPDAPQF